MQGNITIRNERPEDHRAVEQLTREAFYNIYIPGCIEHYLVHIMRGHRDFIPELDFVLEKDGRIIGNIMYTKATLTDESGAVKEILTFGPVCVHPDFQRRGYGKMLIERSFQTARGMGYDTVVIFGSPDNYVGRGFKSCKRYNVCLPGGRFPSAMLVKELVPGALDGRKWFYADSPVMAVDEAAARAYDDSLPPMEKKVLPCQESFYIMSHSAIG